MPRAEAASVAAQLASFAREPTRHRPRFTLGREAIEGGDHVLRFAHGKFPADFAEATTGRQREDVREAAEAFVRQVCFWEGATHYQVLCVDPRAPPERIKEHYHLLMSLIHPDRSESATHAWPGEWAQRANEAYALLSDAVRRSEYDMKLRALDFIQRAPPPPQASRTASRAPRRARRRGLRFAGAVLAVAAVGMTLLLLEAWYGRTPREYSLFEGLGRARAHAEAPRYLASGFFGSHETPAASTASPQEAAPSQAAVVIRRDAALVRKSASVEEIAARFEPPPAPQRDAPTAAVAAPAQVVAESNPAAAPPVRVARAEAPLPAADGPTAVQIEELVARLVGYYEAGEADQLMGLIAGDQGFWETARARQAYADFFRATRQRRLRVDTLQWQAAPLAAHAKGEATVQAQFVDDAAPLDRKVGVEMDIALREGKPRITRLSLYPNAP